MVQGIAFLSKKSWHTKNLANQEKVWIAEQRKAAEESKTKELARQITLEREREELDRLAGKKTHLDRGIDWMYQGQAATGSTEKSELEKEDEEKRAEEFLLGKEFKAEGTSQGDFAHASSATEGVNAVVKLEDPNVASAASAVGGEASVAERNEAFRQRVEDPMFTVSMKEREKRIEAGKQKALYERVMGPMGSDGGENEEEDDDEDSRRDKKKKSSRKRERKERRRREKEERKRKRREEEDRYERKRHRRREDSDEESLDRRDRRHGRSKRDKYYSSDEDSDRDHRRRHHRHSGGSSSRRRRSRSREHDDRKHSRSSSRRHHSRSRSRSRSPEDSSRAHRRRDYYHSSDRHREDRKSHHHYDRDEPKRDYRREEPQKPAALKRDGPSKKAGYGLQGGRTANNNGDLGPNQDLLRQKRQAVEDERRRAKDRAGSRRTMTAEERAKALQDMQAEANARSGRDTRRPSRDDEESSSPKTGKAAFIKDMTERAHGIKGNSTSLSSRMQQNRNTQQRLHDDSFL